MGSNTKSREIGLNTDNEFHTLCQEILAQNLSVIQWRQIESDDVFQSKSYCGGFDADEDAFCFSFYDPVDQEFWFQVTLQEVRGITDRRKTMVKARIAKI